MVLHIQKADEMKKYSSRLEKFTNKGNYIFLNYAHWCGACQIFLPEWKVFQSNASKQGINVVMIESSGYDQLPHVNSTLYNKLSNSGQMYFPMVFMYSNGKKYIYDGQRSAEGIQKFYDQTAKKSKPMSSKQQPKPTSKPNPKPPAVKSGGYSKTITPRSLQKTIDMLMKKHFKSL